MEKQELVDSVLLDIVFLEVVGIKPVLVHGGGKSISAAMKNHGLEAKFINGLRVTDAATVEIVERILNDEINPKLVSRIEHFMGKAHGIRGTDVFIGEKIFGRDPSTGESADLGFVGKVTACNIDKITENQNQNTIPVVTPLAREVKTNSTLNVNADVAAAALAGSLKATKLIYLSDVPGVMADPQASNTLIPTLRPSDIEVLKTRGIIAGGMIPKVDSALDALKVGVNKVHFIDGRIPHSLILEIFTDTGIGTEILL